MALIPQVTCTLGSPHIYYTQRDECEKQDAYGSNYICILDQKLYVGWHHTSETRFQH